MGKIHPFLFRMCLGLLYALNSRKQTTQISQWCFNIFLIIVHKNSKCSIYYSLRTPVLISLSLTLFIVPTFLFYSEIRSQINVTVLPYQCKSCNIFSCSSSSFTHKALFHYSVSIVMFSLLPFILFIGYVEYSALHSFQLKDFQ